MKSAIRWAIDNSPAMNVALAGVMLVGLVSMFFMRREVFPEFDLEILLVSVPYPGASPGEVEEGICLKVEEACRPISGIKKQTTVAQEGGGFLVLELETDADVQKTLSEVKNAVDRIPSFPELAEDPEIQQITLRQFAIRLGVVGPDDDSPAAQLALRDVAERVRNDILQLKSISQANILGALDYQIDVEIAESTLRKYGLTLRDVANIIRRENVEMPGGTMKTESQELLLRGKNKRMTGDEISELPLLTTTGGVVLTVGDLAKVRDEFIDNTAISRIDGKPGLVISVDRTATEDLLNIVDDVKKYVATAELPSGYELRTWADRSVDVRDRIEMLTRNGIQGLILVFLVLAVFLELRLAFWVALGIPVAVLGACAILLGAGQTLNMISLFAFLLALGIVVDDAIVIGENIYAHRQRGDSVLTAAVNGTYEVLPSVIASVSTTIIAFMPLMYVAGIMGKFIAVMPLAVIAMLALSLVESAFILPCHLAHHSNLFLKFLGIALFPFRPIGTFFHWLNVWVDRLLSVVIKRAYLPTLGWSIRNPIFVDAVAVAILLISLGLVTGGITPWVIFPKLDSNWINAKIYFADGTPATVTDKATRELDAALRRVARRYEDRGEPILRLAHRVVGQVVGPGSLGPDSRTNGAHVGTIDVELTDTASRTVTSQQILAEWRAETPEISGVETMTFGTPEFGPGGTPIEFKLLAPSGDMAELERAVERCKERLAENVGVFDIRDDSRPGKWEFQLNVNDNALAMGATASDLAETVRGAYYGEEVMRLQRGRHEVKLMVRYPRDERRSMAGFENIRVRKGGVERPLTELAEVKVERGYSEINRVEQLRSITISADIDENVANARQIIAELRDDFMPQLFADFPNVRVRWEGQKEQSSESMRSLFVGFLIALVAMFMLLTIEFRSYLQPVIILATIPFGLVGALWGHAFLNLQLTMFSMFGLVALTGVVVNDSIVLIDFINKRVKEGMPVTEALLDAGRRRFRPVLLTSITTIAGLLPILLETSFQAQILIPMAASLAYGLMLATGLILILVPTFYRQYAWVCLVMRPWLNDDEDIHDQPPVKGKPAVSPAADPVVPADDRPTRPVSA